MYISHPHPFAIMGGRETKVSFSVALVYSKLTVHAYARMIATIESIIGNNYDCIVLMYENIKSRHTLAMAVCS